MKKEKLLLATALVSIGLSACSSKQAPIDNSAIETVVQETAEVKMDTIAKDKNQESNAIIFEEITAVDNDECSIRITGLEPDSIWGYTLKTELENKSPDKTYLFSITSAAVNGVQCDPLFATEVAPGKKSKKDISFSNSIARENSLDFSDIEILFHVYDSNDWTANAAAEETIHVYPYGKDKATMFERKPGSSDNIIIDNDYVTVIVTGYTEDSIWGYTVNFFLVNKTGEEAMFSVENASINGYMADPYYASSVMPGKCSFSSMSWGKSTFEENGIENVDEIEFVLKVYNSNDWMAEPYANETITLTP